MQEIIKNPLWAYLVLANVYEFCLMGYDKRQAQKKKWRVPEANLLFIGVIGGGLGGLLGMQVFHHKMRKRKFTIGFAVGVLFAALLIFWFH